MNPYDWDPNVVWLFCMTHPDDEISVCTTIRRLVANGNRVHISWTHSTPVREAEAKRASLVLGVPSDNLLFFGATDGQACREMRSLFPKFQEAMREIRPDRVVCGAFEQGHIDHDTTNYLVHRAFDGPIFETPFYHTYVKRAQRINRFSYGHGEYVLRLDPEEVRFKKDFAKMFPSQNIWSVLLAYETWQVIRLKRIELAQSERMRLQIHHDFQRPNHPARIAKKVERCATWRVWLECLREFENALPTGICTRSST